MTNDPHWHHIAMISLHTSPLRQPGTGDSGGMNVYIAELASALVDQGHTVDIFTRAAGFGDSDVTQLQNGLRVVTLPAGPEHARKEQLPQYLDAFTEAVLTWTDDHSTPYTVVHSHYWLSAVCGAELATRWNIPHLVTMHTLAAVKNARLGPGDQPEPIRREQAEQHILTHADTIVANTPVETEDLVAYHGVTPSRIEVVTPGVDLARFAPLDDAARQQVRQELGVADHQRLVLYVGRMQALKAPDVLIDAAHEVLRREPRLADVLRVHLVGGSSGNGPITVEALRDHAEQSGLSEVVSFSDAVPRERLARLYSAADILAIPSRHESFGLVAIEAAAAGTAILAASVGGLLHAVNDGTNGVLVEGHDRQAWATALADLLSAPDELRRLSAAGPRHAQGFTWNEAARTMAAAYDRALESTQGGYGNDEPPGASICGEACTA